MMAIIIVFQMWKLVQRGEATCLKVLSQLGAELGLMHYLEHPYETFPILSVCLMY